MPDAPNSAAISSAPPDAGAAPAPAADAPSGPVDRWNLTLKLPMGERKASVIFINNNGVLTGTMIGDAGQNPVKDLKAEGQTLSWKADVKQPMPMTLKFKVTIDGDTMTGTFKAGMFPASSVTGVRA